MEITNDVLATDNPITSEARLKYNHLVAVVIDVFDM